MKKVLSSILILLLASSLIGGSLVGCSGTTSSSTASKSTTVPLTEATVLIGVDAPLTGPAAPWGLSNQHGVELAFADLNSAGGLTIGNTHYTFKVEALDDKYDTATATDNIRQLIYSDGAQYIFTFQTGSTVSMAPICAQQKVIQFTVSNDNSCISQPTNSYTFRAVDAVTEQVGQYFKWIEQNYPTAKKVVLLTTNDASGQSIADPSKAAAEAAGMTWVDQVFYDSAATTDFTPFLTKLLGEKPDIIDFSASPTGSAALICKTARGLGFTGILSYGGKTAAADMVKIAGQDALEGVLTTNLPLLPPQVSDVVIGLPARETAKYGAAYGNTWDFYSQASIMIAAMKRANSVDSTAVRNILQDSTQKWPYVAINGGVATFGSAVAQQVYGANNASHQLYCSWPICIIRGGKDTIGAIITPP